MPRPRVHDLDHVLDVAETMAVESGPAAVTIRALSTSTSMSNGALYHAFGTRAGLLASAWIRAGTRFLDLQRDAVDVALASDDPVEAVVAAALCPAVFHDRHPASARLLLTLSRRELLHSDECPAELADDMTRLDRSLGDVIVRLSDALWGRTDRAAVAIVRDCVVHLPTALFLKRSQTADEAARRRLAAAVRAVVALPPPDL